MTQATPNTQNQNQNHSQNPHEGQAAEPGKTTRPRRARRASPGARTSASPVAATPAAEPAAHTHVEPATQVQTHEPPQPAQQPQPSQRPRRRNARAAQPQAQQHAAPAVAAPVETPQAEPPQPQQPVAALPAPAGASQQGTETAEATATQQKKRTTRGGRGHRGGRKSEVQLVKPETPAEPPSHPNPQTTAPEITPENTAPGADRMETEPRIVPVVTEAAPELAAAHVEPGAGPAAAATSAAAPASSRFRFGKRAAGLPPETAAPSVLAPEPAPAEAAVVPAATTLAAPTEAPVAAPEEPESWQATVAEIAPEALSPAAETGDAAAVDDLVAALGLRGAGPIAPAMPQSAETAEPAEEAAETTEAGAEEEHQATRRRRRRRGKSTSSAAPAGEETAVEPFSAPEWGAERELRNGYERTAELSQPYSPYNRPPRERLAPVPEPELPAESPFGSPEPQMARGFGPQPRGVAGPAPSSLTRPARERERLETPPMSPNQLANTLSHAIQQQTDRLLGELRRQPQGPAMTFAVPLPSTERVGIFVDVANLLYSARSQHITLDFGKLLDFLRGNRRLIRAHAYAPTNPEPGAEQNFLNAVRGLGYRITTKNYKTFASGAKKADMDLDLCMDIVRMVDSGALDTVVLVSGDSDFLPLLEYASDKGARVEVAAFEDSAAMILRQSCDLFVNLSLVEGLQK